MSKLETRYTNVSKEQLKSLFLFDVLNRDVPYFTEMNGVLYYGLSSQNIKIGKLKGEGL